jgi:hypothetical protein
MKRSILVAIVSLLFGVSAAAAQDVRYDFDKDKVGSNRRNRSRGKGVR